MRHDPEQDEKLCQALEQARSEGFIVQPDDLGPLPAAHPREAPLEHAMREFADFWFDLCERAHLTSAEQALLLAEALAGFASRMVAIERRGQPDAESTRLRSLLREMAACYRGEGDIFEVGARIAAEFDV